MASYMNYHSCRNNLARHQSHIKLLLLRILPTSAKESLKHGAESHVRK